MKTHSCGGGMVRATVVAALVCVMYGCNNRRELYISEVALDAVELYLDEPRGNAASLVDSALVFENSKGESGTVDLAGSIAGDGHFIIYEDPNLDPADPPTLGTYQATVGSIPGMRVHEGFFGSALNAGDAMTVRVHGRHGRSFILDIVDDVVSFGRIRQRPDLGGSWFETGELSDNFPDATRSISRRWIWVDDDNDPNTPSVSMGPVENNSEDDWEERGLSLGRSTRE